MAWLRRVSARLNPSHPLEVLRFPSPRLRPLASVRRPALRRIPVSIPWVVRWSLIRARCARAAATAPRKWVMALRRVVLRRVLSVPRPAMALHRVASARLRVASVLRLAVQRRVASALRLVVPLRVASAIRLAVQRRAASVPRPVARVELLPVASARHSPALSDLRPAQVSPTAIQADLRPAVRLPRTASPTAATALLARPRPALVLHRHTALRVPDRSREPLRSFARAAPPARLVRSETR